MRGLRPSFFGRPVRKKRALRVVTPALGVLPLSGAGMESSHALLFGLDSIPAHGDRRSEALLLARRKPPFERWRLSRKEDSVTSMSSFKKEGSCLDHATRSSK